MQYNININQVKVMEWGLTVSQAVLFSFLVTMPSWAKREQIDGRDFYRVAKNKIITELPMLTDKPDTVYRIMKQLEKAGLITTRPDKENGVCFSLNEICKEWFSNTHTDLVPNHHGSSSEVGTDLVPTYHNTNKHNTNINNPPTPQGGRKSPRKKELILPTEEAQKVMSGKVWKDFVDYRKQRKKPLTRKAVELLSAKCVEFAGKGHNIDDLLNTAIERGWLTIFEPSNFNQPNQQKEIKKMSTTQHY